MSDNEKKIKFKWFEKLKNVKHIEIYVAVIFIVIILLIYFSSTKTKPHYPNLVNGVFIFWNYTKQLSSA